MPDYREFESIWDGIILTESTPFVVKNYSFNLKPNAKEIVWDCYEQFNNHCRKRYMSDKSPDTCVMDRHKVCACYLLAIVEAAPIISSVLIPHEKARFVVNEKLAIMSAASILFKYIYSEIAQNTFLPQVEKNIYLSKLYNGGIVMPQDDVVVHGSYVENFALELWHMERECNYSILSIAHIMYYWERLTMMAIGYSEEPTRKSIIQDQADIVMESK